MSKSAANDRIVRCERDGSFTVGSQEAMDALANSNGRPFVGSPIRMLRAPKGARVPVGPVASITTRSSSSTWKGTRFPISFDFLSESLDDDNDGDIVHSDVGPPKPPPPPPPPRRSSRVKKLSSTAVTRVNDVTRVVQPPADSDTSSSSSSEDDRQRSKSRASSSTSARSSSRRRSPSAGSQQRCSCPFCNATFRTWQHTEVHIASQHAEVVTKGPSMEENARMTDAGMRICEKCHMCRRIGHKKCQPKTLDLEAPPPPPS